MSTGIWFSMLSMDLTVQLQIHTKKGKWSTKWERTLSPFFCPISLVPLQLNDGPSGTVLWKNPRPSSTRFCRPISIRFTKEDKSVIVEERVNLQQQLNDLPLYHFPGGTVRFELSLTMIDGKVIWEIFFFKLGLSSYRNESFCKLIGCFRDGSLWISCTGRNNMSSSIRWNRSSSASNRFDTRSNFCQVQTFIEILVRTESRLIRCASRPSHTWSRPNRSNFTTGLNVVKSLYMKMNGNPIDSIVFMHDSFHQTNEPFQSTIEYWLFKKGEKTFSLVDDLFAITFLVKILILVKKLSFLFARLSS